MMKTIVISFTDSDLRAISRRAFNENQTEAEWIYDKIMEVVNDE